jgi:hypothetical protein
MKFIINSIKILILNLVIFLNLLQISYSFTKSDIDPKSAEAKSIINASSSD